MKADSGTSNLENLQKVEKLLARWSAALKIALSARRNLLPPHVANLGTIHRELAASDMGDLISPAKEALCRYMEVIIDAFSKYIQNDTKQAAILMRSAKKALIVYNQLSTSLQKKVEHSQKEPKPIADNTLISCPLCKAQVHPRNLEKHKRRVHGRTPSFSTKPKPSSKVLTVSPSSISIANKDKHSANKVIQDNKIPLDVYKYPPTSSLSKVEHETYTGVLKYENALIPCPFCTLNILVNKVENHILRAHPRCVGKINNIQSYCDENKEHVSYNIKTKVTKVDKKPLKSTYNNTHKCYKHKMQHTNNINTQKYARTEHLSKNQELPPESENLFVICHICKKKIQAKLLFKHQFNDHKQLDLSPLSVIPNRQGDQEQRQAPRLRSSLPGPSPEPIHGNLMLGLGFSERVERDQQNARTTKELAQGKIRVSYRMTERVDIVHGPTRAQVSRLDYTDRSHKSLAAIANEPFHAMMEVATVTVDKFGRRTGRKTIWYAHERTLSNEVLAQIPILSWTHPGVQLAMTGRLNEEQDIEAHGLALVSVKALARAKFNRVLPDISGIYEPGGSIREQKVKEVKEGLRSVKLDMTPDQVEAFISKMRGMMVVKGAPGTGKTTVALQRVRFLYDQQDQRRDELKGVSYSPGLTKIFLANENLISYTRDLVMNELEVPEGVVVLVREFISEYLQSVWSYKHGARLRTRQIPLREITARRAFFGLCKTKELRGCWKCYESQISKRLSEADQAPWFDMLQSGSRESREFGEPLAIRLAEAGNKRLADDPAHSKLNMDAVHQVAGSQYDAVRGSLGLSGREAFDKAFQQWLFYVYDPLSAVGSYFEQDLYAGEIRIKSGTAALVREGEIIDSIISDLNTRVYGPEEEPWLAWLLRYSLPQTYNWQQHFRGMPWAIPETREGPGERLTHVVIDEAQDLSAPEASFLGSLVHPDGAFTISADFRQVVSPVHGMTDLDAFNIGRSLIDTGPAQAFPFSRNMRQSRSIGRFLVSFYEEAFGEPAEFEESTLFDDLKPQLLLAGVGEFPRRIKQILNALGRSEEINSIALIQINEDEEAMNRLRQALERENVAMGQMWQPWGEKGLLVTSSVERIKGLEYDACLVVGLDDVERASLNFTTNRAYVALSRPTRRLIMLCSEFPRLLQRVNRELFEVRKAGS